MKIKHWIVLLLLGSVGLAQYYVYDSITSIDSLVKSQLNFDASDFGLLYSFYSVANVFFFTLFLAGLLIDYWGYQKSGVLFSILCFIGAVLTAYGGSPDLISPSIKHWLNTAFFPDFDAELKIMLFGRMIFGIGAEAIAIVIFKALVGWFWKSHLAFAIGFTITIYRFGTFLALNMQITIAKAKSLQAALWFSTWVMGIGGIVYLVYLIFERQFKPDHEPVAQDDEPFKLRDITTFPRAFWYLTLVCVTFYAAVSTFEIFDPDILKYRFHDSSTSSAQIASIMLIGTMVSIPLFGWFVDRFGKRATLMVIGSLLAVIGLTWVTLFSHPAAPIFIIGFAYSMIAASLWASVPILIDKKCQGTAFGILGYVQNSGLMLFPWIAGYLADAYTTKGMVKGQEVVKTVNYLPVLILFIFLALLSLIFALLLKRSDREAAKEGLNSLESLHDSV